MKTFACPAAVIVAAVALAASAAAARAPIAFVWPTSVAVEPSGSLLVVENGLHRLVRISPAGRVAQIWALTKPYAVRRARSGVVYVTDGPILRRLAGARATVKVAAADADIGPIAIARNGDVYFTTETALWRLRGGRGAPVQLAAGTRFSGPHGLAVAKDGSVLVADTGNYRILRLDPATGRVRLFARLANPRGLAVAADGTVDAVEASSKRVLRLSAAGRRLGVVGPAFGDPYDLALAPGGVIYVVDTAQSGYVRRVAGDGTVTTVAAA
jgi:serine/threonine protein kinase, bacterial